MLRACAAPCGALGAAWILGHCFARPPAVPPAVLDTRGVPVLWAAPDLGDACDGDGEAGRTLVLAPTPAPPAYPLHAPPAYPASGPRRGYPVPAANRARAAVSQALGVGLVAGQLPPGALELPPAGSAAAARAPGAK